MTTKPERQPMTWDEWREQAMEKAKGSDLVAGLPKQIRDMHHRWGKGPGGKHCKDCAYLKARQFAGKYYKCVLTRMTRGPATDWRVNWPACGAFKPGEERRG